MSIEERIELAVADLEGLLGDGAGIDAAIAEVARIHSLSAEAVRVRGERALGDLSGVRPRVATSKAAAQRHLKLVKIADEFFVDENCAARRHAGKLVTVDEWTMAQFGEPLSEEEFRFVRERVQQNNHRLMLRELTQLMAAGEQSAQN